MFKLPNEASLLATFRPGDRKHVEITRDVSLPLVVNDYLTWSHGKLSFLVFAAPGRGPRGIVFEGSSGGASVPQMCNWCHQVGPGNRVDLLTARRDARSTVGVIVCADLKCRERLEDMADRYGLDLDRAMQALLQRMDQFVTRL